MRYLNINKLEKRFHLVGWLLFLVCAVFFILHNLADSNVFGLIGSVFFLVGCVVFLIPLFYNWSRKDER